MNLDESFASGRTSSVVVGHSSASGHVAIRVCHADQKLDDRITLYSLKKNEIVYSVKCKRSGTIGNAVALNDQGSCFTISNSRLISIDLKGNVTDILGDDDIRNGVKVCGLDSESEHAILFDRKSRLFARADMQGKRIEKSDIPLPEAFSDFQPDSISLITASSSGIAIVFQQDRKKPTERTLLLAKREKGEAGKIESFSIDDRVRCIQCSSDGHCAVGMADGTIGLCNSKTGKLDEFRVTMQPITSLYWLKTSKSLICSSRRDMGNIEIFDFEKSASVSSYTIEAKEIEFVSGFPKTTQAFACSRNKLFVIEDGGIFK